MSSLAANAPSFVQTMHYSHCTVRCECNDRAPLLHQCSAYGVLNAGPDLGDGPATADQQDHFVETMFGDLFSSPLYGDSFMTQFVDASVIPTLPDYSLGFEGAQASMDDSLFSMDDEMWLNQGMDEHQNLDGPPQSYITQPQTIDPGQLLRHPPVTGESPNCFDPFPSAAPIAAAPIPIPRRVSYHDPYTLSLPSLNLSLPSVASPTSEVATPRSPLGGGPLGQHADLAYDLLLEQGYPGDSPIALERRNIVRRTTFNESNQLPTHPDDIRKLAILIPASSGSGSSASSGQRPSGSLPSSSGKRSSASGLVLKCAWAGCKPRSSRSDHSNNVFNRPDRLKTHVFGHINFKPFPCNGGCGIPTCPAKFYSKGDCISHQTRHEKRKFCDHCGEECTGKNWKRHARSSKCQKNTRRATPMSI